jgi:hypothetical protein
LNPQLQQGLGQLANDINNWNNQFGGMQLNQLDPAAVNSHPLMQPQSGTQNQSMVQGLSNLAQSANLSPALQAGLSQLSQFTNSMNNLSPESTVGQAASAASSLMNSAAGLSTAVPGMGAVTGLVKVASMMEKKLAGILNPGAASQETPGAGLANDLTQKAKSGLSKMMKDMMKPQGPDGKN